MVWPLPRPWSETMVSIPLRGQKTLEIKGFLGLERPFLDLVSQALSTENARNEGVSGSGSPILGFGLADPAPKGWG